ncbi:hypothetical protein L218DRAFT_1000337 [Marasmius fiardii PR-910]|nr:hypothetical protein L218DRAFT_1000337 [Marasmius fiardii PR-910]
MTQITQSGPSSSAEKTNNNSNETLDAEQSNTEHHEREEEVEYQPPPPPPRSSFLKRSIWVVLIAVIVWQGFFSQNPWFWRRAPQVIHAKRYSKEFKYRPAASPIITETLKDGRVRIRGAEPSTSSQPTVTPAVKKTRKRSTKRRAKRRVKQGTGK